MVINTSIVIDLIKLLLKTRLRETKLEYFDKNSHNLNFSEHDVYKRF